MTHHSSHHGSGSATEEVVVVENVVRRATGETVQTELESMGYLVQVVYANACQFGVCQSRSRVYIAGVLKKKVNVIHGPDKWCQWLQDCRLRCFVFLSLGQR